MNGENKIMTNNLIVNDLISYLKQGNPLFDDIEKIPLDESLVELGFLDSFGIVEIVMFVEEKYNIQISDDEISKENFGSINKMAAHINKKIKN